MAYYDALSEGYDELYGKEQSQKFKLIMNYLSIEPEELVLDLGCGTGLSCAHIKASIVGADPASAPLLIAKTRLEHVVAAAAENLPFESRSFDYTLAVTVVHNFDNEGKGLMEIERVTKSTAVISVLRQARNFDDLTLEIERVFENWQSRVLNENDKDIIFILTR